MLFCAYPSFFNIVQWPHVSFTKLTFEPINNWNSNTGKISPSLMTHVAIVLNSESREKCDAPCEPLMYLWQNLIVNLQKYD